MVNEAIGGETIIVVNTSGAAVTVTFALPTVVPFVAVTIAIPAALAVNVVDAFPFISVITFTGATFPATVLLLAQVMLIPCIGTLF